MTSTVQRASSSSSVDGNEARQIGVASYLKAVARFSPAMMSFTNSSKALRGIELRYLSSVTSASCWMALVFMFRTSSAGVAVRADDRDVLGVTVFVLVDFLDAVVGPVDRLLEPPAPSVVRSFGGFACFLLELLQASELA